MTVREPWLAALRCKKCGSEKPPDNTCSRCGGYGLVHGSYGDPTGCPRCGESGSIYPPFCPDCSGFRAASSQEQAP